MNIELLSQMLNSISTGNFEFYQARDNAAHPACDAIAHLHNGQELRGDRQEEAQRPKVHQVERKYRIFMFITRTILFAFLFIASRNRTDRSRRMCQET